MFMLKALMGMMESKSSANSSCAGRRKIHAIKIVKNLIIEAGLKW
jgi:hypothetical protein